MTPPGDRKLIATVRQCLNKRTRLAMNVGDQQLGNGGRHPTRAVRRSRHARKRRRTNLIAFGGCLGPATARRYRARAISGGGLPSVTRLNLGSGNLGTGNRYAHTVKSQLENATQRGKPPLLRRARWSRFALSEAATASRPSWGDHRASGIERHAILRRVMLPLSAKAG